MKWSLQQILVEWNIIFKSGGNWLYASKMYCMTICSWSGGFGDVNQKESSVYGQCKLLYNNAHWCLLQKQLNKTTIFGALVINPDVQKNMFCVYTHFMMRNVSSLSFVTVPDGATKSGYCVWPNTGENIWRQYDSHGDTHARPVQDCRNAHSACEFFNFLM